jgi:hypothetical protein
MHQKINSDLINSCCVGVDSILWGCPVSFPYVMTPVQSSSILPSWHFGHSASMSSPTDLMRRDQQKGHCLLSRRMGKMMCQSQLLISRVKLSRQSIHKKPTRNPVLRRSTLLGMLYLSSYPRTFATVYNSPGWPHEIRSPESFDTYISPRVLQKGRS